jgi:hypothetical protein
MGVYAAAPSDSDAGRLPKEVMAEQHGTTTDLMPSISATKPQRRPVIPLAAGRRVPTREADRRPLLWWNSVVRNDS